MKRLPLTDLLAMFDASVHSAIRQAAARCHASHLVAFENLMMDSSALGQRTVLCVGPGCTYESPEECEGHHLNDLPSQRQYPVAYALYA